MLIWRVFCVPQVLNHYHKDALAYYNSTTDLRALCSNKEFADREKTVKTQLRLMTPFAPMLCKRQSFDPLLYDTMAPAGTRQD